MNDRASAASPSAPLDPLSLSDFTRKEIIVPRVHFEPWMARFDWTYHQLARGELPYGFESLEQFQLACICQDPLLWCSAFLKEPEDPDHDEPYNFWDFQVESLRYDGSTVHKCASEIGKTREIVAWVLWKAFTVPNGSGLIGAPQQTHLEEIIEAIADQLAWNPELGKSLVRHKKSPHHAFYFANHFKIDFRPSGHDGEAYRGVHVRTFAIKDEAAKDKNKKQWSEFWRAIKPGAVAKIYSVPDGDRSCEFYRLGERARRQTAAALDPLGHRPGDISPQEETLESFHDVSKHVQNLTFRLYQWAKPLMPYPFWSDERRRFYADQYGGEDSPEYKHNVLGEDGDPEHTVFPWHQFRYAIRDIPEYRCLKILVNAGRDEVAVTGYRCSYVMGDSGPVPQQDWLIDEAYSLSSFFAASASIVGGHPSELNRMGDTPLASCSSEECPPTILECPPIIYPPTSPASSSPSSSPSLGRSGAAATSGTAKTRQRFLSSVLSAGASALSPGSS